MSFSEAPTELCTPGTLQIEGTSLRIQAGTEPGEELVCRFHRTNRLSYSGGPYPLPPGLGDFPLERVVDHTDRLLPATWRKYPGLFFPMNEEEAFYVSFRNVGKYAKAIKVASGQINCLTGAKWTPALQRDPQDYMVVGLPTASQPWLDGHHCGPGFIRQFVATPKGSGKSVEAQVTGEEKYGGIQMIVYLAKEPNPESMWRPRRVYSGSSSSSASASGSSGGSLQIMRSYVRRLRRTIREFDREIRKMQIQEKKLIREVKDLARKQMRAESHIVARDLIKLRSYMRKFYQIRAQMTSVSLKLKTMNSTQHMAQAMLGVMRTLRVMNLRLNIPQLQRIVRDFARDCEIFDMKEMMSDCIDDLMECEEEYDDTSELASVLDEIGLETSCSLGAPVASSPSSTESDSTVDDELEARLAALSGDSSSSSSSPSAPVPTPPEPLVDTETTSVASAPTEGEPVEESMPVEAAEPVKPADEECEAEGEEEGEAEGEEEQGGEAEGEEEVEVKPVRMLPKQVKPPQCMCLAAGGKMRQRIVPDPNSLDFWDQENVGSMVWIHLVSARGYFEITGNLHEGSPAVWKQELIPSVPTSGAGDTEVTETLANIKGMGELEKKEGD